MLEPYRGRFNAQQFSPDRYADLQAGLVARTGMEIEFRIAETPCFFSRELLDEMAETGRVLTHQLIDNPEYMRRSETAIPAKWRVAGDNPKPNFMTVDFGLVRNEARKIEPKLVELQAFPSVFGYQDVLCQEYVRAYGLEGMSWYAGGMNSEAYWDVLRRTIVGEHDPATVVLSEVQPETQKTRADFGVYAEKLGVRTVDVASFRKEGKRLFASGSDGKTFPVSRIYNRAIVDEMERKGVVPGFDYRDELEVEWAGQPNWYFRISKFSLPYLDHPSVPTAVFLDDWFAGKRGRLPEDRNRLLLKPLYSFAGKGIQFEPSDEELKAIPESERGLYLLQERVRFTPVIATPQGMTQAEIRVMYCWPEDAAEMIPMTWLVRMGRGLMMGVDHNRNQEWVGSSAALFPRPV
jgi:hypothetical protein